jgi:hypothetical protein
MNMFREKYFIFDIDLKQRYYYLFLFERLGVESILGPLGTAATPGLLYMPQVIVRLEKLVE